MIQISNIHTDAQLEAFLREQLNKRSKAWLREQLISLVLPQQFPARVRSAGNLEEREKRLFRLREMQLCKRSLHAFLAKYEGWDRQKMISGGYLHSDTPTQGTEMILPVHRCKAGETLLTDAKDILFGLLFGDETTNTHFHRTQREILSLTLPQFKSGAFAYLKAATQHRVLGTWQDPDSVSNDLLADNVILEVEYGETSDEIIGNGIVLCLRLINLLEVNEQILYGRMANVEQSTLV